MFLFTFSDELKTVYRLIFDEKATTEDKKSAYLVLQSWKVRRSQETLTGILCTLSLLDVHIKDLTNEIADPHTLSTLYASTLTKFINYASSFEVLRTSMYKSAEKLGIDSFLIDLRHLCAHGKQLPCLDVFRRSHRYCLDWIKTYFWESEMKNVSDVTSIDIRYDAELSEELRQIFPFYDTLAQLLHQNIVKFTDLAPNSLAKQRWPTMDSFMKKNKLLSFRHAFAFLTDALFRVIQSKRMTQNPSTFFHEMFVHCDHFMQASESSDDPAVDKRDDETAAMDSTSPPKRGKPQRVSIVNLYQRLIWQISRHGHLKLLLDMLCQVSFNESENPTRRTASRFWITIILKSFGYYQKYYEFSKSNPMQQTMIDQDVREVYCYQLDADLTKVFILVGTQILPSSLKYSRDFFMNLVSSITAESDGICLSLLPFVHPPLSQEQLSHFNDLIHIETSVTRDKHKVVEDKVYTLEDLLKSRREEKPVNGSMNIWEASMDNINWSAQPIGQDFSLRV